VKRVRVAVVDDSALVRKTVRRILEQDARFEVVGMAANGAEALDIVDRLAPDVVTLDLDMPVVDGMSVLPRLVNEYRQRVLVLSTLTTSSSYPTFKALAMGAIDFVTKPGAGAYLRNVEELGLELRDKLAAVAAVPRERVGRATRAGKTSPRPRRAMAMPSSEAASAMPKMVVGIGGSTGSTSVLEGILSQLAFSLPVAVVVVQHLPVGYSKAFAGYLSALCPFSVREAEEGQALRAQSVYLAPGDSHLRVQPVAGGFLLRIDPEGPPLHGYRPAIDELFYSLANAARQRAVGVLLSGMGGDGGCGLAAIRRLGGRTLAQQFDDCVVPEMPTRAVALGGVERLVPAQQIALALGECGSRGEATWARAN
jgi:two-component system, chemotaxis family, protein-glutamate methylesterase/glutaminase